MGASSGFGYLAFAGLSVAASGAAAKGAARAEGAALPAAGQAGDLPLHGGRAVARRHVRLQAEADRRRRQAVGDGRVRGAKLLGSPWKFPARPERALDLRAVPGGREARRRPVRDQRSMQTDLPEPPAGVPADAHRQLPVRPAVARGLDAVRARHREREPARFVTISPPAQPAGRRTTAARSCRRSTRATRIGDEAGRSPTPRSATSRTRGSTRPPSAPSSTSSSRSTARRSARRRQARRRGRDRVVRAGLPHAGGTAERDGPRRAERGDEKAVRHRRPATDDFGRQCLLARRFVEAGVRFVESAHGGWDQHHNLKRPRPERRGRRPADRRPAGGPQARAGCSRTRW